MTNPQQQSPAELAEWMSRQILPTFAIFEEHRDIGDKAHFNAAWWARGRIDAFLQIMGVLDHEQMEKVRADWERIAQGEDFTSIDDADARP